MSNAFQVSPNTGYEVLPEDLEIVNCTGRSAYFAVLIEGKKKVVMLVNAEGAGEINLMNGRDRGPSDQVD